MPSPSSPQPGEVEVLTPAQVEKEIELIEDTPELPEALNTEILEENIERQRKVLEKVGILNSQGSFEVKYLDQNNQEQTEGFTFPTADEVMERLASCDQDKLTETLAKFEQDGGFQILILPTIPLSPDSPVISAIEGQMKELYSHGKLYQSDGKTIIDGSDGNSFNQDHPTYIDSEVFHRAFRDPQNPNNFISQEQWATGSAGFLVAIVPLSHQSIRQRNKQNPFYAFNAGKTFPQQLADITKTGNQDLLYLTFELCAYRQLLALFPEDNQPAMVLNDYSNSKDSSTWVLGLMVDESQIDAERRFAGFFSWFRARGQLLFDFSSFTNLSVGRGCVPASVN